MSITQFPSSRRRCRAAAGVALGGALGACGASDPTAAPSGAPSGARGPAPGLGKAVTGTAAAKAKAAALARYPGSVERVMRLGDGSYVVHVLRSSGGEVHAKVSKAFAVPPRTARARSPRHDVARHRF